MVSARLLERRPPRAAPNRREPVRRRHPPGRRNAPLRPPEARRRRAHRVLRAPLGAEPLLPLPRFPTVGSRSSSRSSTRTGWREAPSSGHSRAATAGGRRAGELARLRDPAHGGGRIHRRRRPAGRGMGTRLLEQLAQRAAAAGIERFVAEVMGDNAAMMRVFEDAGFGVTRALDRGTFEVAFPIEPTDAYREHVEERDHLAVVASLARSSARERRRDRCVAPAEAIGGISSATSSAATSTAPPTRSTAGASPSRAFARTRSIEELPEEVDLAVICLPGATVLDAAREALEAGIPRSASSRLASRRSARRAAAAGAAARPRPRARRPSRRAELPRDRGRRRVAQRDLRAARAPAGRDRVLLAERRARHGAAREGVRAQPRLLVLRLVGNKADVSSNDLLEYWEDDESTELIALYLESFGNPRRFGQIASRVARKKPILAMKAGRRPRAHAPPARTPPRSPAQRRPSRRCSTRPA